MEYTNGTKSTWRYWAWKQLREKIRIQPGLATVLFLSGPSPEDLVSATKNGFKIRNIVAVDIDPDAVKAARSAGCVAIEGDIHDVVKFWNDGDIHAVMADYCCGLSYEQFVRSNDMAKQACAPVCLNFQRGRESSALTTVMRSVFEKHQITKNRAEQFIFMVAADAWHKVEYHDEVVSKTEKLEDIYDGDIECIANIHQRIVRLLNPVFMSYRSNAVLMDSVVIDGFPENKDLRRIREIHKEILNADKSLIDRQAKNLTNAKAVERELNSLNEDSQDWGSCIVEKLKQTNDDLRGMRQDVNSKSKVISRLIAAKAIRTMNGAARPGDN